MSYQNVAESQIKGYNDCPPDLSNLAAPSASRTRRPRLQHTLSSASSLSQTSGSPTPPTGPPMRRVSSAMSQNTMTTQAEVSDEQLTQSIEQLLSYNTTLPQREFDHYAQKLRDCIPKMTQQSHRAFLLSSVENCNNKQEVNKSVVKFMMGNDGTSTWAVPLRKLLEGAIL